ncbi:MAG: hypothetical protein K2W93_00150 [Burkholderiaceae bacterium]|nr:hypothetical protein [Burkholderiaceae bacterium]
MIRLRSAGIKLKEDALAGPTPGYLRIYDWTLAVPNGSPARKVRTAVLALGYEPNFPALIPELHDVQITRMDAVRMILVGRERTTEGVFPQAWAVFPQLANPEDLSKRLGQRGGVLLTDLQS